MDLVSVFCKQIGTFPTTFVEEAVFSQSYVFGIFVKNKMGIAFCIHIWVLCSVPLVFISVFVLVHAVFIAMILKYNLKLGIVTPTALPWLFLVFCASK
jgi:hypothetical protein